MLYFYRKAVGLPSRPTRGRVLQGSLRASLWLEYLAWSATGVETHHTIQEGGMLRIRDLENQLFEEPPPRRPILGAILRWFSSLSASSSFLSNTVSSSTLSSSSLSLSPSSSSSRSSIDDNIALHINTPEPQISQPQTSTAANGTGCATTKHHGKIKTHEPIASAQSSRPSRIPSFQNTARQ